MAEKPANLTRNQERIAKVKLLRQFSDAFSKDKGYDLRRIDALTSAQRRKIDKYFAEIEPHTRYAYIKYTPRKKKKKERDAQLKTMADYTGQKLMPGIKRIPVPVADPTHQHRITIKPDAPRKEDRVHIVDRNIGGSIYDVRFDPKQFVQNPHKYLKQILKDHPDATVFMPLAGEWSLYRTAILRKNVLDFMDRFIHRYIVSMGQKEFIYGFRIFTKEFLAQQYQAVRVNEYEARQNAYKKQQRREAALSRQQKRRAKLKGRL